MSDCFWTDIVGASEACSSGGSGTPPDFITGILPSDHYANGYTDKGFNFTTMSEATSGCSGKVSPGQEFRPTYVTAMKKLDSQIASMSCGVGVGVQESELTAVSIPVNYNGGGIYIATFSSIAAADATVQVGDVYAVTLALESGDTLFGVIEVQDYPSWE